MVQKDGRKLFSESGLLMVGNMVPVLQKVTNLHTHGLSDSSPLFRQLNGNTSSEHFDRNSTILVTL
jgi:hypothetical protein